MAGAQGPRFAHAAHNDRPYKSHRYDVFGVKIERGLFLYGDLTLSGFIALESDPDVLAYCERPIVIDEMKPKRVVDFWVQRADEEELWFLLRPSELKWTQREFAPTRAFHAWAESRNLSIQLKTPERLGAGNLHLRNWAEIIRYLTANLRYIDAALFRRVSEYCREASSIGEIQAAFPKDDPILVRTAILRLLHKGTLIGTDLGKIHLGPDSVVRPA